MAETPALRFFEAYPACMGCGRAAAGVLRGDCNQSYGAHCKRCADRRLKDSAKAREGTPA